VLPNFLIVGAEKAGTTTLAEMLGAHPDVFMSDPKEPRFFSGHNWDKGIAWYESLFRSVDGQSMIGEASPSYTWAPESPETPARIQDTLGDVRYLYIVRSPVDRVVSHYRHALFHRWLPDGTTFEAALAKIPGLLDCSRYASQLERFDAAASRDRWHVVVLEELIADHRTQFRGVCEFLGVDPAVDVGLAEANVADQKRRPPALASGLRGLQRVLPRRLADLGRRVLGGFGEPVARPVLDAAVRAGLQAQLLPEVERLSEFVGRDLAAVWDLDR